MTTKKKTKISSTKKNKFHISAVEQKESRYPYHITKVDNFFRFFNKDFLEIRKLLKNI